MENINKLVSCNTILSAIDRTFKPTSSSWMNEAIEDIGWAIQAIGYHMGFVKKQTEPPYLIVANNRAKIPCDVERIIAVEQLLPRQDSHNHVLNPDGTTPSPQPFNNLPPYEGIRLRLGSDISGYGIAEDNPRTTKAKPSSSYYNINTDFIIVPFSDGLLKLHYIGFAVDKKGLPMVIDDADYKLALQWYCVQNMILKGHKHPEVSFRDAFQMWEMYRLRAENAGKVQSLDSAERFRATWNRYNSGINLTQSFDMHFESPEQIDR